MTRHFECTACGKCCHGQISLTLADGFAHADRFPLAFLWTPLQKGHRDYAMVSSLGATIKLADKTELALLVSPTAYVPASFPCIALREDNLCGIHATKPLRCRTVPFSPYREEHFQSDVLAEFKHLPCDTSVAAPIVFQDKKIIFRDDFDLERQALLQDVPLLRRYVDYTFKYTPMIANDLAKASLKAKSGQIITSLSSFLTATRNPDAKHIAQQQFAVFNEHAAKTAGKQELEEYHRRYTTWAKEMMYLANRVS